MKILSVWLKTEREIIFFFHFSVFPKIAATVTLCSATLNTKPVITEAVTRCGKLTQCALLLCTLVCDVDGGTTTAMVHRLSSQTY